MKLLGYYEKDIRKIAKLAKNLFISLGSNNTNTNNSDTII